MFASGLVSPRSSMPDTWMPKMVESKNTAAAATHATRETETRKAKQRDFTYTPPSQLDSPTPKDGTVHRWVRISLMGTDDDKNLSLRRREGWEVVRAEEHPEFVGPVHSEGRFTGVIGVGDLVLMKWDERAQAAKKKYIAQKTERLQAAMDSNLFREEDSRMPIQVNRRSSVATGSGLRFDE